MKINTYYTLKEILESNTMESAGKIEPYFEQPMGVTKMTLATALSRLAIDYTPQNEERAIFYEIINKYWENYASMPMDSLDSINIRRFFVKLVNIMSDTKDKYIALIKAYDAKKNNLLDGVKSSTTQLSKYNDTPQNNGEFIDDDYVTNLTNASGTSETDVATPIERLSELSKKYENILADWASEYAILFLEK